MTALFIAISAALALLALGLLVALVKARRSAKVQADALVAEVMAAADARSEALAAELDAEKSRVEAERSRAKLLAGLVGSLDLDEVISRVLEAATELPGADAALVALHPPNDRPIVATLGLTSEEAEREAVARPPEGSQARSIAVSFSHRTDGVRANGGSLQSGLAVPLCGTSGEELGLLTVFTRSPWQVFEEAELQDLEELTRDAGPAIENALRFREARQLADLDALTELHNRRYFHETLAREVARARRYERRLTLIVFDLDDFKDVNDRIGHLAGDAVLAEIAARVRSVVRSADIACRVGGDEFAVIVPEASLEDGEQLFRRIQGAVSASPVADAGSLDLSGGITELHAADDGLSFFERADEALYEAKQAGKGRAVTTTA